MQTFVSFEIGVFTVVLGIFVYEGDINVHFAAGDLCFRCSVYIGERYSNVEENFH